MLDKLRAMGDYIKNNHVGDDVKQRFHNVLQGYKAKMSNAKGQKPFSAHSKVIDAINNHKAKFASRPDRPSKTQTEWETKSPNTQHEQDRADLARDYGKKALSNF